MREVADLGRDPVVLFRGHHRYAPRNLPPEILHPAKSLRRCASAGRDKSESPFKKIRLGVIDSALVRAGHRMSAHKMDVPPILPVRPPHEKAFHASGIGHDRSGLGVAVDLPEKIFEGVNRRAKNNERGRSKSLPKICRPFVNPILSFCNGKCPATSCHSNDPGLRKGFTTGGRKRAANQT